MIKKAAVLGDRIILNLYPAERIGHARKLIDEACEHAGKQTRPTLSVMLYSYLLGEDTRGLEAAKDLVSFYASAPAYSALFASIGYRNEAKALMDAWKSKDRELVRKSVTRNMIDKLIVFGSVEKLKARVREYHEAQVDDVFLCPSPFGDYEGNVNEILVRSQDLIQT
jgi:alkanesulfonate monooxygenase SsuD/methylene tetrahydromethanopterin reductase-like flavin-dependent oxidoreductase (luciferase family)